MFASADELFGYSSIILGVAPLATQLGLSPIYWILLFPIVALPVFSLLLPLGHLANTGPVLTYKRIVPLASGIGWGLTWLIGERLYVEGLRAVQNLFYIVFSIRTQLTWATQCGSNYNSKYCMDFFEENITVADYHHYPDNYWPAQEFNRYYVRGNAISDKMPDAWEPNEWYLGHSTELFEFAWPSVRLTLGHALIWILILICVEKLQQGSQSWFIKIFVVLPVALYTVLMMGMSVSGFHFGLPSIQTEIDEQKRDSDPFDFWADVRGLFRTSLLLVDYSAAFTGIILYATSRVKIGSSQLNPYFLLSALLVVPTMLTILRSGCEGHITDLQPAYKAYISTDETISFDLLPVCFATSRFGPLWSVLYFTAQLLYSSIGPMVIYTSFIYQSFVDEIPTVQNKCRLFLVSFTCVISVLSLFLYMPMGTKITLLFRYASQSSILQILCFIVIFFVYGWQTVEADVLTMSNENGAVSFLNYLLRPTSPIFTILLFTVIPALLCAKFVAVFDLLVDGNDIVKHIDAGASFIPGTVFTRRLIGYGIMFMPIFIVTAYASYTMYSMCIRHKLPYVDLLKSTTDWMQHTSVNNTRPREHSLAYGLFNSLSHISYKTLLLLLFIFETFVALVLILMFFLNSLSFLGFSSSTSANHYRSLMLFVLVLSHLYSLYEIRSSQRNWDSPERLSIYIAVATMECAMLNGYMWMFTTDHSWGIDGQPLLLIFLNTVLRGAFIIMAIAIRAHMTELIRPPTRRTRDASEIYDVDTVAEMDAEDDSPIIFDVARA
ncbi:unnamed protein product [Auanema sp. JU1783]|nr:unnamed protein product [Auanema sp. JU1783]